MTHDTADWVFILVIAAILLLWGDTVRYLGGAA